MRSLTDITCRVERIIAIKYNGKNAFVFHTQLLIHGSQTVLGEVSDERELFLTAKCRDITVEDVVGLVSIKFIELTANDHVIKSGHRSSNISTSSNDYICKFLYDDSRYSFVQIPASKARTGDCALCAADAASKRNSKPHMKDRHNILVLNSMEYHLGDYVLIGELSGGPKLQAGLVAQIVNLNFTSCDSLYVRWLGRVSDVDPTCSDSRFLFLSKSHEHIDPSRIVQRCSVLLIDNLNDTETVAADFFVQYWLPTATSSWSERKQVNKESVLSCQFCHARHTEQADKPLKTLDLFAGTAGFSSAMSQNCPELLITHAIEIDSNACKTVQHNHPSAVVINTCANLALEASINAQTKIQQGKSFEERQLPLPGDIDVLVAGFPCQSHSSLNMFKRADDPKTNLMLTLLSNVDFYRPQYCYFENVWQFVNTPLMGVQEGPHCVVGGIRHGALKFMLYALTVMGYQCRFSILQAGMFGAPQSRERFFLIAAPIGIRLPEFPTPTHAFHRHAIRNINPVAGLSGLKIGALSTAWVLYPPVTVKDAIGDLYPFDWSLVPDTFTSLDRPVFHCKEQDPYYGELKMPYLIPAATAFQKQCRIGVGVDCPVIQHYTYPFSLAIVNRAISIPLYGGSDYRSLGQNLLTYETADPMSAQARHGFKSGAYARLHADGYFHTTVTNVSPTAKQSWVLNPWCLRVLTIRELARTQGFPDTFIFRTVNDDFDDSKGRVRVRAIHRQIGNAVAWPVARALGSELRRCIKRE